MVTAIVVLGTIPHADRPAGTTVRLADIEPSSAGATTTSLLPAGTPLRLMVVGDSVGHNLGEAALRLVDRGLRCEERSARRVPTLHPS